jgi:hypothetical protein
VRRQLAKLMFYRWEFEILRIALFRNFVLDDCAVASGVNADHGIEIAGLSSAGLTPECGDAFEHPKRRNSADSVA